MMPEPLISCLPSPQVASLQFVVKNRCLSAGSTACAAEGAAARTAGKSAATSTSRPLKPNAPPCRRLPENSNGKRIQTSLDNGCDPVPADGLHNPSAVVYTSFSSPRLRLDLRRT